MDEPRLLSDITPRLLCITGLHRSGTTIVGEIIKKTKECIVLREPLNPNYGVQGGTVTYPYGGDCDTQISMFLDDVIKFRRGWLRVASRRGGLRGYVAGMVGNRDFLRWNALRLRASCRLPLPRVCWKDPFASLATPYLVRRRHMRAVCMVRHPAAIHVSTARQAWSFAIDNLSSQPELLNAYGQDVVAEHWRLAAKHDAASIALLWKFMVRVNLDLSKIDDRLKLVRHEDFCMEPVTTADMVLQHFGLSMTTRVRRFVELRCHGSRVQGKIGEVHDFDRDSKQLVGSWRSRISPEDWMLVRKIAGPELQLLYPDMCE